MNGDVHVDLGNSEADADPDVDPELDGEMDVEPDADGDGRHEPEEERVYHWRDKQARRD